MHRLNIFHLYISKILDLGPDHQQTQWLLFLKQCSEIDNIVYLCVFPDSDDIVRAVKKLKVLGSGMEVVATGSAQFIYSIPGELSMDHTTLLQLVR